ncbi:hypothetical protein CP532_6624 [Ophiocordyceps camponoti-leonardi (nom. inval.)]|nr:hypothetical protein CP532_6624 [Ophiocordyceps camponoti-leonardi (nom. inval.)]
MSDASFGNNYDRQSTHGFIIRVFGGAVAYKSGKQDTAELSAIRSRTAGDTASRPHANDPLRLRANNAGCHPHRNGSRTSA